MRIRMFLLRAVTLVVFVAMLARLYSLQFGEHATSSREFIEETVTRIEYLVPRRGEIFASDGRTLLAASEPESVVGILQEALPKKKLERDAVFLQLSSVLPFTDTFTISPTTALLHHPELARDVSKLIPILPPETQFTVAQAITLTVPPGRSLDVLQLGVVYADVITLNPGVAESLGQADLPPYVVVPVAQNVSRPIALALRENQASLPGVRVIESYRRIYPQSSTVPSLAHILGYVRRVDEADLADEPQHLSEGPRTYLPNDSIGKDGLEASYERQLRGILGINQIEVDVYQRTVGSPKVLLPKEDGRNLVLHVDLELQQKSEAILSKWLQVADQRRQRIATLPTADGHKVSQYGPINKGVIVVMDVRTGGILASVSLPAYDNNLFVKPFLTQAEADSIFQNPDFPLFNRALSGAGYPPGSTFKQFTGAAALHHGIINTSTQFNDLGRLVVRNKYRDDLFNIYPNSGSRAYGMINVSDALMVSSNVFFQMVSGGTDFVTNLGPSDPTVEGGLGIARLHGVLVEEFRFGTPTGVDLPGESAGLIPDPEWKRAALRQTWSTGDTYISAIGQGDVKVTPLQLLRGTVATATNGTVYRPQFVKAITSIDQSITITLDPQIEHQIDLDPQHWAVIREGMRRSVQDPQAYNRLANFNNPSAGDLLGDIDRFNLAGKTGTAEYEERGVLRSHSWFVGFAPFDNPEIAVVALLEGTGDLDDGSGTLALPAVVDVLRVYYDQPVPGLESASTNNKPAGQ